jgi:hypothetical protein
MFEKNLALVQKKFPWLYQELYSENPSPSSLEVGVGQSRTGLPVAYVMQHGRKVFLNSSYDPEQEAGRWVNSNFNQESSGSLILCGGGFLYHVKALLEADFLKKLVVYEPEPNVIKTCMTHIDLEPILKHDNLFIITGSEHDVIARAVFGFLGSGTIYSDANVQTKSLPGYLELFGEEIGAFLGKIREQISLFQMNLTTLDMFAKEWLSNSFKNLNNAINSPVVGGFFGKFKNTPAVLVSAGPSLEKNIHLLKDLKDKALIICSGSSIRAMVRNGILPHILVAVDSSEVNGQVFDDLDLRDIYLVHNCRFWYKSAARFAGRQILFKIDDEGIPELFIAQNRGMEIGNLQSGFSVSHTSLDLAARLGCEPIIMIGQDLSYSPDKKRYAEGQIAATIDFFDQEFVKRNMIKTLDIYGREVITDYELNGFRLIFELMIEKSFQGKINIINATEGGIPIKGTVNRTLADVIAEYCQADLAIGNKLTRLYEEGMQIVRKHPIDATGYCKKLNLVLEKASLAMAGLMEQMQALRKLNFNSEFHLEKMEPVLQKIASDYDSALNYKEYHLLLKDFHSSVLYVLKAQLDRITDLNTPEDYDKKLQIYMNIIINTKDVLDFTMDCIRDFLTETEPDKTTAPETMFDSQVDMAEYETRIKQGKGLRELLARLEALLREPNVSLRGTYLYLYGLTFARKGERERAITFLEQAVKEDHSMGKAFFALYKLYAQHHNRVKALDCLSHCCRIGYRKHYCLRKRIRLSYRSGDFITVNNLIEETRKEFSDSVSHRFLKIEALARLNLIVEAEKLWLSLKPKYRSAKKVISYIQSLLTVRTSNPYQEQYQTNTGYFERRFGLSCPPYHQLRYKVCRFLSGEFVYDTQAGIFYSGVNHVQDKEINLSITDNDIIAIFNTDNSRVFEHLLKAYYRFKSRKYQKQMGMVPVFIIEQEPENWYFIAQLFDFSALDGWENLHLFLMGEGDMVQFFLEDTTPFPNILYGTTPKQIENAISFTHNKKEDLLSKHLPELTEHYRESRSEPPRKIVILGSIQDEGLMAYGKALQSYFQRRGIECIFMTESPPFYKRSIYTEAKLIHQFRPDLVISMIGIQEELELYSRINIPFISWLQFERQLVSNHPPFPNQRFWITGNLDFENRLTAMEYCRDRIYSVPLPVLIPEDDTTDIPAVENGIGIFADLEDLEELVENIEVIIFGMFFSKGVSVNRQDIVGIIKALYVSLYLGLNNEGLKYYDESVYENVLLDNLKRRNLTLEAHQIRSIAPLIKKELDNLMVTSLQVKWIVSELDGYGVEIYGSGWSKEPSCQAFYKGDINSINHLAEFYKAVRRNKVNLYPGIQINNHSYIQPDLLNGIAAGGFFLVNDLWVKQYGGGAVEAFGEMLETYGSKTELMEKVKYFLVHEEERLQKIQRLRDHVTRNFSFDKLGELVLNPLKSN